MREAAERDGYTMLSRLTTDGLRGGVVLFWNKQWVLTWSCSLSPRILLANIKNEDGLCATVLAAHFHHSEAQRSAQMHELLDVLPSLPLHEHVLVLAYHNSVIGYPGIDSKSISVKDTIPQVVKARDEEAAVLTSLEV